jgi:2,5-diketo-D-gluconate reductase B
MTETPRIGPIPQIGYGTWTQTGDAARACVSWALEAGYRHIDTAVGYGNEAEVGAALAEARLARSEVFVTTKVPPEDLGPGMVRPAVERSLEKLRTDQVDLLLIHWPSQTFAMEDYLAQLADVFDQGLARFVGVSNFTIPQIDQAMGLLAPRTIATNQVELHPLMQNRPIVAHCRRCDIPLTAYAPLARGAVAEVPEIVAIAKAHGATPGQVALAFLMAEDFIVIPTSSRRERIVENFGALEVRLTPAEIETMRGLDRGARIVDPAWAPRWDA